MVTAVTCRRGCSAHSKRIPYPETCQLGWLIPHPSCCRHGECLNFYEVMLRARERNEIVLGFRNSGMRAPVLNPKNKSERMLALGATTSFVTMAEDMDGSRRPDSGSAPGTAAESVAGGAASDDDLPGSQLLLRSLGSSPNQPAS